jgi:UDP-N-acetyl-D-galactosamine dehydrogenase
MGGYVAEQIVKMVISQDKHVPKSRVLIMGVTFKENVSDIRNTKVVDIISELQSFGITQIDVIDPCADTHEVNHEYGFHLADKPQGKYDVIVLAVNHREYLNLPNSFFKEIVGNEAIFVDIKGIYRKKKPDGLKYWSL